ncbi:MAG: AAA family ATPase [Verrucomicrobiota bacterium]
MPPDHDSQETLSGTLEKIIFANAENHYTIGELRDAESGQSVTIAGNLPGVQCGETLELHGTWTRHPTHGQQFKIKTFQSTLPSSVHGIRKYLGSGMIPNIGPKFAEKIVDHFGAETLKVISEQSARLREVPGVGKQRAKDIKDAWEAQQAQREIMLFLHTYGVSTSLCMRIYKKYGNEARTILEKDPYRVAREINGVGFRTADQIARNIGLHNDDPRRLEAGLIFYLEEYEALGNTEIAVEELITQTAQLLEIEEAAFSQPLRTLVKQGELISGGQSDEHGDPVLDPADTLQLPKSHRAEVVIAQAVHDLLEAPSCLPPIIVDKAVEWAQERAGFTFAPEQAQAIHAALEHKISVLTGGPGTGKTTILVALADILKAKKVRLLMAAPTGRAAQRMSETTRHHAQTIHRLLKYDPAEGGFSHHMDNPLACDFLVVDEASMLDSKLAACLLRAIPHRAHLLLVGDADQLPSVGAGNVLADLIAYIEGYSSASSQSPHDSMP